VFRFAPVAVLAALAAALPAAAAAASGPSAHAAGTCKVPSDGHGWGPTYVTSMAVAKVTCAQGTAVVKAYYRCRVAGGGKRGTCSKPVLGFRCREQRGAAIKTQFDAKVTCTKGGASVRHTYTQFT
jgi:hypothetical protein